MRRLLRRQEFWLALLLLVLGTGIGLANPAFWSFATLFDLCQSSTVMGLFAWASSWSSSPAGSTSPSPPSAEFSMYVTSRPCSPGLSGLGSGRISLAGVVGGSLGLFNALSSYVRLPT
jgi:hypothetical protein